MPWPCARFAAARARRRDAHPDPVCRSSDARGRFRRALQVGSEPDQVTFSPDGRWLLVANEAEPNDPYTIDPEGSVTIVDLRAGPLNLSSSDVRTATFTAFNNGPLDPSIRI